MQQAIFRIPGCLVYERGSINQNSSATCALVRNLLDRSCQQIAKREFPLSSSSSGYGKVANVTFHCCISAPLEKFNFALNAELVQTKKLAADSFALSALQALSQAR